MCVSVGGYRITFGHEPSKAFAFFGKIYSRCSPYTRLVWTNEESDAGALTTVTFEEADGGTLLTFHELYPSKEALDETFSAMEGAMPEQFGQLDELLDKLRTGEQTS